MNIVAASLGRHAAPPDDAWLPAVAQLALYQIGASVLPVFVAARDGGELAVDPTYGRVPYEILHIEYADHTHDITFLAEVIDQDDRVPVFAVIMEGAAMAVGRTIGGKTPIEPTALEAAIVVDEDVTDMRKRLSQYGPLSRDATRRRSVRHGAAMIARQRRLCRLQRIHDAVAVAYLLGARTRQPGEIIEGRQVEHATMDRRPAAGDRDDIVARDRSGNVAVEEDAQRRRGLANPKAQQDVADKSQHTAFLGSNIAIDVIIEARITIARDADDRRHATVFVRHG